MPRKRSIASLLDDDETTPSRNVRSRSTSNIIDEESSSNQPSNSRLVRCNCSRCNGRYVDNRTKLAHEAMGQYGSISNIQFEISEISMESQQSFQIQEKIKLFDKASSPKLTILSQDIHYLEILKED